MDHLFGTAIYMRHGQYHRDRLAGFAGSEVAFVCHETEGIAGIITMSRAAALADRKGTQKAAIAAKKDEHAADLAIGLNSTMAKLIKGDELLCTACGATTMGPTKCECSGGRQKPGPDYCCKVQLIEAAKARGALLKAAALKDLARKQGEVSGARTKKRDGLGAIDVEAELQGDGVEILVTVELPIGKLGLSLEKNCVSAITGDPAQEKGVKRGWILSSVGGEDAPNDRAGIERLVSRIFREQKAGLVPFRFRSPIVEGFSHCVQCDKYLEDKEFEPAQLAKGPGKQMCEIGRAHV